MIDTLWQGLIVMSMWELTEVLGMIVFCANTVSVWLPNHSDNRFFQFVLDVLNAASLNIMKNANRLKHSLEDSLDEMVEDDKPKKRRKRPLAGGKP